MSSSTTFHLPQDGGWPAGTQVQVETLYTQDFGTVEGSDDCFVWVRSVWDDKLIRYNLDHAEIFEQ